jgi:hypothetical protein
VQRARARISIHGNNPTVAVQSRYAKRFEDETGVFWSRLEPDRSIPHK